MDEDNTSQNEKCHSNKCKGPEEITLAWAEQSCGQMGAGGGEGGDGIGSMEGVYELIKGGLVLCFVAAGIDILGTTPAEGDRIDPLGARDPERVNGQVVEVVGQAKFILDVGRFTGFFGGEKDDGVGFADGITQGSFPVGGARGEAGLVDPDRDAVSLQVSDEAVG